MQDGTGRGEIGIRMTRPPRLLARGLLGVAALALLLLAPDPARAAVDGICSVVDSAKRSYRGALGFASSPVVIPGFPGELSVPTGICDAESTAPDFRDGGSELAAGDLAVAFVFKPVLGPDNTVVLSDDCAGLNTSTCDALGIPVDCVPAGPGDLQIIEGAPFPGSGLPSPPNRRVLRYRFPDTTPLVNVCLDGAQAGSLCRADADCGGSTCGQMCVGGEDDGLPCSSGCELGRCGMPYTGPVAVAAVQQNAARNDPVPCQLQGASCADAVGAGGFVACIDDVFRFDGTCRTTETERDPVAFNVTALPEPVSIADVCSLETDPSRNKCVNGDNVGAACTDDADCPNGSCGVCRVPNGLRPTIPAAQDKAGRLASVASANGFLVVVDGESFPWLVQAGTAFGNTPLAPVSSTPRDVNYSPLNPLFFGVRDPNRPGVTIASVDAAFAVQQSTRFACAQDPSIGCTTSAPGCTCTEDSLAPLPSPLPGYASGAGPALLNVPLAAPGGRRSCSCSARSRSTRCSRRARPGSPTPHSPPR